jgi:hypothetical protein
MASRQAEESRQQRDPIIQERQASSVFVNSHFFAKQEYLLRAPKLSSHQLFASKSVDHFESNFFLLNPMKPLTLDLNVI